MFTIAIFYVAFIVLVMVIAAKLGRMWFVYGLLSLIVSPLLTGLVLLCLGKTDKRKLSDAIAAAELMAKAQAAAGVTVVNNNAAVERAQAQTKHEREFQARIEEIAAARKAKGLSH